MRIRLLLIPLAALSLLFADVATSQGGATYTPITTFVFKMPGGGVWSPGTPGGPDPFRNEKLDVQRRLYAVQVVTGANFVDANYLTPIRNMLGEVPDLQLHSQSQEVRNRIDRSRQILAQLTSNNTIGKMLTFAIVSNNRKIFNFAQDFANYAIDIVHSVDEASKVPDRIDAFVKSNEAGKRLLVSASERQGLQYGPGMQCNDLVQQAGAEAGSSPEVALSKGDKSVTQSWFKHGMGQDFKQIYGGDAGQSLAQLASEEGAGKVTLPIGSIIVADGHAAVFTGVIMVNKSWQLVTYDANGDHQSWTVSLAGTPGKIADAAPAPKNGPQTFPGHQVGEHVTRLQWGDQRPVKVFQPIGNHPKTSGKLEVH
jgi:hypothetical protein